MPVSAQDRAKRSPPGRIAAVSICALIAWLAPPAACENGTYGADWLQVRGIDKADVRSRPSGGGALVARLPDGAALRNKGCAGSGSLRWCQVETPDGDIAGWIYARFLSRVAGPEN